MGFTKQQNPEASVALPHAVLEHELFKRCFEQVAVSRISGERPSVEVYALCKGSCNIAAAPRAFGRCEDTHATGTSSAATMQHSAAIFQHGCAIIALRI